MTNITNMNDDLSPYWQNVKAGKSYGNDFNNFSDVNDYQSQLSGLAPSNEGYIPDFKNFDILNG